MGFIAHLRKQFKSINTYDYIIALIRRNKTPVSSFWRIECLLIWKKMNPLHPRMLALCHVWLKLAQWFGIRSFFFYFVNVFSLYRNHLPLKKSVAAHLNKLESPPPKNTLCQVWLKLALWFGIKRFLNFVMVFFLLYFVIISLWKMTVLFI